MVLLFLGAMLMPLMAQGYNSPGEEIIVYRLPEPARLYIYRGGMVVYDAKIQPNAIINNTFILPENVQLDSLTISQADKRIYAYTTAVVEALVVIRSGERPNPVRIVQVHIPQPASGIPLEVKYGVRSSGLSWEPILDMEVKDQNYLDCALLAVVRTERELPVITQSILARRPEIILASSQNVLLDDLSSAFSLGNPEIAVNMRMLFTLETGRTNYSLVYLWDANNKERPAAFLRAPTPFKTVVGGARAFLNSSGMNLDSFSMSVSPDHPFDFHIGDQPNITTYKSVVTSEHPERENLPFTHALEYKVTNQMSKAVLVEISVPVSYGVKHRTEYHFTKNPDERPGERMVWKYNLAPGQEAKLTFSFDSEFKDSPLYSHSQFNYSEGGR